MAAEKDPMVLRRRWQALSKEGQARFQMYLANARRPVTRHAGSPTEE
jgi:hypothetical protein